MSTIMHTFAHRDGICHIMHGFAENRLKPDYSPSDPEPAIGCGDLAYLGHHSLAA